MFSENLSSIVLRSSTQKMYLKNRFSLFDYKNVLQERFLRSLSTKRNFKSVYLFSLSKKSVLQERERLFFKEFICTPRTCSAFFNVPSKYSKIVYRVLNCMLEVHKEPYCVLQLIYLYIKNVLRSSFFMCTPRPCMAFLSVPSW